MSGSNGQACPECAAPRRPDGTPSCGCTRRASDALRDARTAQAAAAEDFNPLRIRPYVDIPVTMTGTEVPTAPGRAARDAAADETMPLAAVPEETRGRHALAPKEAPGRDATMRPETVPEGPGASVPPGDGEPRRRRRTVLLAAAGAVVAVAAAAAFAGGLLSYDTPQRDEARPDGIRAGVPDESRSREPSASTSTGSTGAPMASASASASAGPTPSTSTSPSVSASPSRSTPATPSTAPTTATPTGSVSPTTTVGDGPHDVQVLRLGSQGPEVTGLQLRLRQLNLYTGPAHGNYNKKVEWAVSAYQSARGITQDEPGVYGPATRAQLESETREP